MPVQASRADGPRDLPEGHVCLGEIGAARGLRGEVFVRSFTAEPEALADYGPLIAEPGGRLLRLRVVGEKKGMLVARIDGIGDRDAAEGLRGLRLCVPRSRLPEPDTDEFYHADLIGLDAEIEAADGQNPGGTGRVTAVHDFGAGAVLEIARPGAPAILVPFTRQAVPVVDLPGRRLVVAALPGLLDGPRDPGSGDAPQEPTA